jgi:hypothetical protein
VWGPEPDGTQWQRENLCPCQKSNTEHPIIHHSPITILTALPRSSRVHTGTNFPESLPVHSKIKYGDALSPLLFSFVLKYAIRKSKIIKKC